MEHVGLNIKKIREKKGLMQKEIAAVAGMHPANYNKVEKGEREPSIEAMTKIATLFGITIDELIHNNANITKEIKIEDKTANEKLRLMDQLEEEDKQAVYRIIDGMLTKAKFKDFFNKNIATL